jgi:hypothetical protein
MEECQQTFFRRNYFQACPRNVALELLQAATKPRYQKLSGGPLPSRQQTGSWERKWGIPAISRPGFTNGDWRSQ